MHFTSILKTLVFLLPITAHASGFDSLIGIIVFNAPELAIVLFIIAMFFSVIIIVARNRVGKYKIIMFVIVLFCSISTSLFLIETSSYLLMAISPFTPIIFSAPIMLFINKDVANEIKSESNNNFSSRNRNACSKETEILIESVINNNIVNVHAALKNGGNPSETDCNGYCALDYARGHGYNSIYDILQTNITNHSTLPPQKTRRQVS